MSQNEKQTMEAKRTKIYEQAIKVAETNKCFFIDQVVSFLPIVKSTFYDYFPVGSNESNSIKELIPKQSSGNSVSLDPVSGSQTSILRRTI